MLNLHNGRTWHLEPTFLSRIGAAKDAVISGVKDRYSGLGSFDKGALMNLGKDVLVADLGASAVEMGNAQQQALEDQQLAQAGYSVSYPSGFGTQRVIRDSSGVIVNATAQDILARALGGGRMQFAPKTTFALARFRKETSRTRNAILSKIYLVVKQVD